jgi:hypothetical protein
MTWLAQTVVRNCPGTRVLRQVTRPGSSPSSRKFKFFTANILTSDLLESIYPAETHTLLAPVVTTRVYIKKEADCGQIAATMLYIAAHSYYN